MATDYIFDAYPLSSTISGEAATYPLNAFGATSTSAQTQNKYTAPSSVYTSVTYTLSAGATSVSGWCTGYDSDPPYILNDSWETSGTETVVVTLATFSSNVDMKVRILRVNSSLAIQATGSYTAAQTMSAARTFTPSKPTWGTTSIGDRYVIEISATDTRTMGTSASYSVLCHHASSNTTYATSQVNTTGASVQKKTYYLTNDASDLSTYTNGNYEMNATGESAASSVTVSMSGTSNKTIGFITPAGTPNNAAWETTTSAGHIFSFEISHYNPAGGATAGFSDQVNITFSVERLNSSGTVQESSTVISLTSLVLIAGASPSLFYLESAAWNKAWGAGAVGDRLALKLEFVSLLEASETSSIDIRVHDGTNKVGAFYSLVTDSTTSGTTYYQTCASTATGVRTLVKSPGIKRAMTAIGVRTIVKQPQVTKAKAAVGVTTMAKQPRLPKAMTAIGVASLSKQNIWSKILAMTSVGVAGFLRAMQIARAYAATAIGYAALVKQPRLVRAAVAVGARGFSRLVSAYRSSVNTAVGVASLVKRPGLIRAMVATGARGFSRVSQLARSYASTAIGVASLVKRPGLVRAMVSVGVAGYNRFLTIARVFTNTAVGVTALQRRIGKVFSAVAVGVATNIATLVRLLAFHMTAIGVVSFSRLAAFKRAFSNTAVGSATVTKRVLKTLTIIAMVFPSMYKKIILTAKSATAVGVAGLVSGFSISKIFNIVATGVVSFTKHPTFRQIIVTTATGVAALSKRIAKSFAAIAVATVSMTKRVGKVFANAASGVASFSAALVSLLSFSMTAVGVVTMSRTLSAHITAACTAVGVTGLGKWIKKMFGMTSVGSVSVNRTYIPSTPSDPAGDSGLESGFSAKKAKQLRKRAKDPRTIKSK